MVEASAIAHVAVLVPARDEEALLPRCLRSVQAARSLLSEIGVRSDVIVVADSSLDRTAEIARDILGDAGLVIEIAAKCVGAARAAAAATALARYGGPAERCWLANTDADCEVPIRWLRQQLVLAARGTRAVAGIVDVDDFGDHDAGVAERFRQTYLIHRDGTHPHVHGANLGVRADAYLLAGGWAPLATAEDHDLWGRLRATGTMLVSDAALTVVTSGRRHGRAPRGFADALAAHGGGD